jgi:hypothetical protein
MIQLSTMMWISAVFFAVIGAMRGWNKEIITLCGIVLALFALYLIDNTLRGILLASVPSDQAFVVQMVLFAAIVYTAYRARGGQMRSRAQRERVQDIILGAMLGALNGYLIWGSFWYFLDINEYPLSPLITAPALGSASAQSIGMLPMLIVGGATGGSTEFVTIGIIVFVLFVLMTV